MTDHETPQRRIVCAGWFNKVKAGDTLRPQPDWNRSERPANRLPDSVKVLQVLFAASQSGLLFTVRTNSGSEISLDAAWFMEPGNSSTAEGSKP